MPKPAKSCMDPPEWRICRAEGTSTWQNRFLVERPWKKERQMENARARARFIRIESKGDSQGPGILIQDAGW